MNKIEDIIAKINDNIQKLAERKANADCHFRAYGLTQIIKIKDENYTSYIPAIIRTDGECEYVFSDDWYDLGVYHRIISQSFAKGQVVGRNYQTIETSEIALIVWGFSNRLNNMNVLQISEKMIIPAMPADIELVNVNFDKSSVVGNEFRGFDYDYKPEEFLFSVRYKIVSKYIRDCMLDN